MKNKSNGRSSHVEKLEVHPYTTKYKVIGTRPIRHDGLAKVTGQARYGADINMPGLLHSKLLRSPHAHANIVKIDTSRALKIEGVKAIITGTDFPITKHQNINLTEVLGNARNQAENVLATNKVLFKGHAVAAVAATTPQIAQEAINNIDVEYEILPSAIDLKEAMSDNAPLVHENMTTLELGSRFGKGTDTGVKSNISSHLQFKGGDLEKGFKESSVIVEREYSTKSVHQGYIEPQASTAQWHADNTVTIWTSTQHHFGVRGATAAILEIPEHVVTVIPMEIGGGFGGKIPVYLDPICALLSKKTGSPVKAVLSRKEVFESAGPTSGSYMWVKMGADEKGYVTAAHLYLAYEAGAFPRSPVGSGAVTALTPYKVDNFLVDAYDVIVNKTKVSAYRAPGSPQAAFAIETVIDELAEKLNIDKLDFRLQNAVKEGDRMPNGIPLQRVGCIEVEQAMQSHPHYNAPLSGPNKGRGVAIGYWGNFGGQSSATLAVNSNGTVNVITGSVDIGGTRPAVAMQAAEVLGLTAEDMIPTVGDTNSVGYTDPTGGSRTAFTTGIAAINAARKILNQMSDRAALLWEIDSSDVEFTDGVFINGNDKKLHLTFKELAGKLLKTGGPISASASASPRNEGVTFCGNIVDVEVDPETGKVDILRYTAFQDVGQAAHPSYVEGQMQGGTVQGIGWALNEEYFLSDDGTMLNSSFLDYRMPTSLDLPMIDTVLVEVPHAGHPFGLRGVGEVPIVPPMAAISNAIYSATGIRMTRLPMSPGAILEALGITETSKSPQ